MVDAFSEEIDSPLLVPILQVRLIATLKLHHKSDYAHDDIGKSHEDN